MITRKLFNVKVSTPNCCSRICYPNRIDRLDLDVVASRYRDTQRRVYNIRSFVAAATAAISVSVVLFLRMNNCQFSAVPAVPE